MSQSPQKLKVSCPGCGKQYVVPAEYRGKTLSCKGCSKAFRLPGDAAATPVSNTATVKPSQSEGGPIVAEVVDSQPAGNCGICQCAIESSEPAKKCPACSGAYHLDCWDYNKGCGVYGCSEAPPTEGLNTLEIPPSHWGQEDKNCPQCNRMIKAAAVRCRHCGAVFETANPQDRQSFHSHRADQQKLPAVKAVAVVLLIFSLIPCTAPLAAIGGTIWYVLNRRSISMLPPFHAALCKIAVGVSIAISILLIIFAILNLFTSAEQGV